MQENKQQERGKKENQDRKEAKREEEAEVAEWEEDTAKEECQQIHAGRFWSTSEKRIKTDCERRDG